MAAPTESREKSREMSDSQRLAHPFAAADRVTLVSGLPRSGTSLLMQMLEAAGIPLAHDGARLPDSDNPRGYFELAAAKRLRSDAGFLDGCRGRAVKLVAPLLLDLPSACPCRVLFIERDLGEILASQRAMLERQGLPAPRAGDPALARGFESALARCRVWLTRETAPPALIVRHRALVDSPGEEVARITRFLEETADAGAVPGDAAAAGSLRAAMVGVVEPALHRQRATQSG